MFLLIVNLLTIKLISQSSFEFILYDSVSSICYDTFQDNDGYFISVGTTTTYNFDGNGLILKFKGPDNIITKVIEKPDSIIGFGLGFQKSNGNYFIIGGVDKNNTYYKKNLYIIELNTDMLMVNQHIHPIPTEYGSFAIGDFLITSDNKVILAGYVNDYDPGGWEHYLCMIELDMDGNLINMKISQEYKYELMSELIENPQENGYYIIGDEYYYSMLKLDKDLNVTGKILMDPNNTYYTPIGAKWLSSGNIITGSLAGGINNYYDLMVKICDTNLNVIKDTIIVDAGMNVLPAYRGLDFIDEDNIWMVTYPQYGKNTEEWQLGRIYLFDSELNVKGSKYFGDMKSLYLCSISATDDGGCIITGEAADGQNKGYTDVYIKKVKPEDIFTSAEDTPDINDMDVLLYPVPFEDVLYVETFRKGLTITVYSSNGVNTLSNKKLDIPYTAIQTSDLKSGLYFYSVFENTELIQSGKIIKK